MDITPSNHQWDAIRAAKAWYKAFDADMNQFFYIGGFAGTGKTAIAKFIVAELGLTMEDICAACFTGKAAHILRLRGFPTAQTIHSLIYRVVPKGKGRYPQLVEDLEKLKAEHGPQHLIDALQAEIEREISGLRSPAWMLKPESDLRRAKLLVVDEVSMLGEVIALDLMSFEVPILVLGDPGQLPPVGDVGYFTNRRPHFMLTEIHRQAKESAVIRLATMAREEGRIEIGVYEDPSGFPSIVERKPNPERLLGANQIIVGMNKTRHRTNAWVRAKMGRMSPYPMEGDRLICLRNRDEYGLMNGAMYTAMGDAEDVDGKRLLINIMSDDFPERGAFEVLAHRVLFGGDPSLVMPWDWEDAQGFDFGNAITGHKSQASQYPHVAIKAEWPRAESWKQWAYTVLSRAQISNYVIVD